MPVVDDAGAVLPETLAVLERMAHHGLVLATGHLSRDEIFAVVDAAVEAGVTQIVITHPEFPAQSLSLEDQAGAGRARRAAGAVHHHAAHREDRVGRVDRRTSAPAGPENSVLSTDLGQAFNPPVEDGMAIMVDRLLGAGFDDHEVRVMAVANTRRVAGVDPW